VFPVFFRAPYLSAQRAMQSALDNDIELEIIDVSAEHLQLLYNPVYGFGKRMNPCIDCHGFMFRKAAELLEAKKADFIISGEVLGQRPMSQRRDALDSVAKLSGVRDLIVRPLSQLHLTPTKPVREGWVLPEDLLDFHGRGRYAQLNLAKQLGVKDFPSPAGGCLLTDRNYCLRLKDLMDRGQESLANLELLAYGRHFRLNEDTKLIIGRDEPDNDVLETLFTDAYHLQAKEAMGPLGLLIGAEVDTNTLNLALQIFMAYNKNMTGGEPVMVQRFIAGKPSGEEQEHTVSKASPDLCKQHIISYS